MKHEQLAQALRDMAATNLRLAQTIADIRESIFGVRPFEDAPPPRDPGHQSYCAAIRHSGEDCDCEGYGEYQITEDEEPCPYCREGRSHTSELCRRSGGQG